MKLEINNLSKSYDKTEVLVNVTGTFEKGHIYGILGRNGSGKTTLFQCINGDLPLNSGSICFDGEALDPQDIGMVYSDVNLPEFLTGYEFLKFFVEMNPHRQLDITALPEYFQSIQFSMDDAHRLIKDYSFGMRNKLQMLTVLLTKPKVLLLDEPLTSFDLVAAHEIKQMLLQLKSDCIMLLSTHILQIAKDMCDDIIILHNKTIQMVDHEQLMSEAFEEQLMEILRDDA